MPRRSCSGAGKEEAKNAERRCRRQRLGLGLVDDGANRAHEVFSACHECWAYRSRGLRLLKPKRTRTGKEESRGSLAPLSLDRTSWRGLWQHAPLRQFVDL